MPDIGSRDEIELISDGDGLVVIGKPAAVQLFVAAAGVPSRELDLRRLNSAVARGGSAMQTASEVSANAGRWMKLTEESARAAHAAVRGADGMSMVGRSGGEFVQATTRAANGQFAKNLQFVGGPGGVGKLGSMLTNPALLAGVGGIMAQYAMQKQMEEITEYLAKIDAKVDDILRAQKDAVLADMIGVELMLDEAMIVRAEVGRVSEVTWSKVQGSASTIARTQAYALRQLDGLAEKLERETKIGDLADLSKQAQDTVVEWLAVLARCFQLQEGLGVLELDRVLDASPDELDKHRVALQTARQRRRELIATTTTQLVARMDSAASRANAKVLLNPMSAKVVVHASNHVAAGVGDLQATLGVADERAAIEARRWTAAAADARDDVVGAGADGLQAVGRFGNEALENARMSTGRLAGKIANRLQRTPGADSSGVSEAEGTEGAP
ncbi:hypothetical protein A8L33_07910 [Microbacterium aurantiacum]|uniref:Uncharacterized protein n=2 Tax=Microbacterium aurantiacum TaxID=162393 RepID=A0A0M8MP88_9MICO|nr:hypothetical protein A8L33_07910 [Microbacterium chocolatum]KOS11060.1 hypothetical protein XI38_07250 [Microbacterium chocolatum]